MRPIRKLRIHAARPFWWLGNRVQGNDRRDQIELPGFAEMTIFGEFESKAKAEELWTEVIERVCGCYGHNDCVRPVGGGMHYSPKGADE